MRTDQSKNFKTLVLSIKKHTVVLELSFLTSPGSASEHWRLLEIPVFPRLMENTL